MTMEQRILLSEIHSTFGSLLFISDNVGEYGAKQLNVLKDTFAQKDIQILRAELETENVMAAEYVVNGERRRLRFDVRTGKPVVLQHI